MHSFPLPPHITQSLDLFSGRAWFPSILYQWFTDPKSEQIFLLTGGPGTGKSMIMGWLATAANAAPASDHHKLAQQIQATHFCLANDRSTYTPLAFADHIANQLSAHISPFDEALTSALKGHGHTININQNVGHVEAGATVIGLKINKLNLAGMTDNDAFDISFVQALQKLYENHYDRPLLILIDALDEAWGANESGQELVKALANVQGLPPSVKLLMTSRPDPRLLKHFRQARIFDVVNDAPSGIRDIYEFADSWLKHRQKWEAARASRMAQRIDQTAAGIFLYAYMILHDVVPTLPDTADVTQFPLPNGLNGIYENFLTRELGASMKRWFDELQPFLGLIAVAQGEGVSRTKIRAMIDKEDDLRDKITANLYLCQQYLTGELNDGPFRIFHKSLNDFLLADPQNKTYEIDAQRMHRQYAKAYRPGTDWAALDPYTLRYLPDHLAGAERYDDLISLLLDFNYLQAKLDLTDINDLIDDFDYLPETDRQSHPRLVQSALQLSATVLARDKTQLAAQLVGRLSMSGLLDPLISHAETELGAGHSEIEALALINRIVGSSGLQALVMAAEQWRGAPWLRPIQASLIAPDGPLIKTLTDHKAACAVVKVFDHGRKALCGDANGVLILWDLTTAEPLNIFDEHTDSIEDLSVTADGQWAVSSTEDRPILLWNLQTSTVAQTIPLPENNRLDKLELSNDGRQLITLTVERESYDRILSVWNAAEPKALFSLIHDEDEEINAWHLTPDGRRIITTALDELVCVWDMQSGSQLVKFTEHTSWVEHLLLHDDGQTVVSGDRDGLICIWNVETGQLKYPPVDAHSKVDALAITPDGRYLISGGQSPIYGGPVYSAVKVWDLTTGELVVNCEEQTGYIKGFVCTPDSANVISFNEENLLIVWELKTGSQLLELSGHKFTPTKVLVTPDGRYAVSTSSVQPNADYPLIVWDLNSGKMIPLAGHTDQLTDLALSPDGSRLFSFAQDQTVRVWDMTRPDALSKRSDHGDQVACLGKTADSQQLISVGRDNAIKIWAAKTQELGQSFTDYGPEYPHTLALSADGQTIISVGYTEALIWQRERDEWELMQIGFSLGRAYDLYGGSQALEIQDNITVGHKDTVRQAVLTPDLQKMVTLTSRGSLIVWDLAERQELFKQEDSALAPRCVAITADGQQLIVGHEADTDAEAEQPDLIIGREPVTGKQLFSLAGHTGRIELVALTADDQYLVSADSNGQIKLWDLAQRQERPQKIDSLDASEGITFLMIDQTHLLAYERVVRQIHIWNVVTAVEILQIQSDVAPIQAAFNVDKTRLGLILPNKDLALYDVTTQSRLAIYTAEFPLTCLTFLFDNELVAGDEDGTLHWLHLEM